MYGVDVAGSSRVGVEAGSVGEDDVAWLLPFGKVVFVGVAGFLTRSTRWKVKNITARKATTPRKIFRLRLRGLGDFVGFGELCMAVVSLNGGLCQTLLE